MDTEFTFPGKPRRIIHVEDPDEVEIKRRVPAPPPPIRVPDSPVEVPGFPSPKEPVKVGSSIIYSPSPLGLDICPICDNQMVPTADENGMSYFCPVHGKFEID